MPKKDAFSPLPRAVPATAVSAAKRIKETIVVFATTEAASAAGPLAPAGNVVSLGVNDGGELQPTQQQRNREAALQKRNAAATATATAAAESFPGTVPAMFASKAAAPAAAPTQQEVNRQAAVQKRAVAAAAAATAIKPAPPGFISGGAESNPTQQELNRQAAIQKRIAKRLLESPSTNLMQAKDTAAGAVDAPPPPFKKAATEFTNTIPSSASAAAGAAAAPAYTKPSSTAAPVEGEMLATARAEKNRLAALQRRLSTPSKLNLMQATPTKTTPDRNEALPSMSADENVRSRAETNRLAALERRLSSPAPGIAADGSPLSRAATHRLVALGRRLSQSPAPAAVADETPLSRAEINRLAALGRRLPQSPAHVTGAHTVDETVRARAETNRLVALSRRMSSPAAGSATATTITVKVAAPQPPPTRPPLATMVPSVTSPQVAANIIAKNRLAAIQRRKDQQSLRTGPV
jgi:hypothetical protein